LAQQVAPQLVGSSLGLWRAARGIAALAWLELRHALFLLIGSGVDQDGINVRSRRLNA
jgi:hypothetical protein